MAKNAISEAVSFIDKRNTIEKAAVMSKVPLHHLDRLIKERQAHALCGNYEAVEYANELIKDLLGL